MAKQEKTGSEVLRLEMRAAMNRIVNEADVSYAEALGVLELLKQELLDKMRKEVT